MTKYIATFHTHFAALATYQVMTEEGIPAHMAPVPRAVSADCGTCVCYASDHPGVPFMHQDFDCIYEVGVQGYVLVVNGDAL